MSKKYYVVKNGKHGTHMYRTWEEAKAEYIGMPNARVKGFNDHDAAQNFAYKTKNTYSIAKALNYDNFDVVIHTDGGCRNHGNVKGGQVLTSDPAAWSCYIEDKINHKNYLATNGEFGKSNNYMEVKAVLRSLQFLEKLNLTNKHILFVCDSIYALKASDKEWLKTKQETDFNIPNGDLWREINRLLTKFNAHIVWSWTRGHAGEYGNEIVDSKLNETMDHMQNKR